MAILGANTESRSTPILPELQIWAAIEAVYSFLTAGWAALCSAMASLSLGWLILELRPSRSVPVRISQPSYLISALSVESTGISHTNLRSRLPKEAFRGLNAY